jgi:PKD repeat protein
MLSSHLARAIATIVATLALGAAASPALADPVVMAAGDVACSSQGTTTPGLCSQRYVAGLAVNQLGGPEGLSALLAIGDLQYESGGLADFRAYFGAPDSWGQPALRPVLRPVPGNHEYQTSGASGYYNYFAEIGVGVGTPGQGWYSFNVGSWHFIGLNSSDGCSKAVSCAKGSAQETWLANDLATNTQPCVAAYFHHPINTVGGRLHDLWQDLYDHGVELALVGHNHGYAKIVHRNAAGSVDPAGPGEIVVGTGGKSSGVYGLLKMTLHPNGMDYNFVGSGTSDSGSLSCDGSTPPPPPPPPPSPPTAGFSSSLSGRTLTVSDTSTGAPTSWAWDFGDGATSSVRNPPAHTYAVDGTYTVKLTATNAGGGTTTSKVIKVATSLPPTPPADATPKPGPTQPPVTNQAAALPPAVQDNVVTPPSVVTQSGTPVLTAAKARTAMRKLLANRLRDWTLTGVTCKTTDTRHAQCTFRARRDDRRASGSGVLVLLGSDGRVSVKVQARLTGRYARRTTWTGRVRS